MATLVHGTPTDQDVREILKALNEYETRFNGAKADVYRQNPGAIRVRIIDDRFAALTRSQRHDDVWQFLATRVGADLMAEISALILVPTAELRSSLANLEFEDRTSSRL